MSYVGQVTAGGATHSVGSTLYGTCATAAATAAKVVTCADFDKLITGVTIKVKFTNTNTVANPTLNVNGTGAKNIYRYGTTAPSTSVQTSWYAGAVISFTYDGTYWMMDDWTYTADGSDTSILRSYYSRGTAGGNGIKQYSLFARINDGTYSSFTTGSGTGTKTMDTTNYYDIRKIYYANRSSDLASGSVIGDNQMSQQENTVDGRYTFNSITTSAGFTANKPIYLVFDKTSGSNNYYKIKSPYWTHTPSDTDALYVLIGFTRSVYQFSLMMDNAIYEYKGNDKLVPYGTGGGSDSIWTSSVTGLVGDTQVTIQDLNISTTSRLAPYCENSSGTPVGITSVDILNGSATLKFPALTETTTFRLLVSPVMSDTETAINAQGVFIDTNNFIYGKSINNGSINFSSYTYTATEDCYAMCLISRPTNNGITKILINDKEIYRIQNTPSNQIYSVTYLVKKGQVLKLDSLGEYASINIYGLQQGSNANVLIDYSTNEQYTGQKWIDGKPIYQKTFTGQLSASGSSGKKTFDTGSLNIDNGWISEGYYYGIGGTTSNTHLELNEYVSSSQYCYTHLNNGTGTGKKGIDCTCVGYDGATTASVYVTIKYTKT